MKAKIKSIFFFFIFLITFNFIIFSGFSPFVNAVEDTQILGVDLLSIDTGKFIDNTPGDTIRSLKSSVGGRDVIAFENLGMISYNEETHTALYGGIITFGAEANAYTDVLCEDAYPTSGGTNFNKETAQTFLSYQIWKHLNIGGLSCTNPLAVRYGEKQVDKKSYNIYYREIEFGTLYRHNFDGMLPFMINMDPGLFLSKIGKLEVFGEEFTVPKITSNIKTVREINRRGGAVGGYEDRFTGKSEGIDEVKVDVSVPPGTWDYNVKELTDWFNDNMVGTLQIGNIPLPKDCPTIQESVVDLTLHEYPVGGVQDYVEIPFKVHLQPEIYRIPQTIALKYGHFHWWKCCKYYRQAPFVTTRYFERNIGMHVSNVFFHTDFEIKVEVAMSCKFDVALSESFLEDPNLVISDRIWNEAIYGETDVKVSLPYEKDMWSWILILIIIIIATYLILQFVVRPYLRSKKRAVQIVVRK